MKVSELKVILDELPEDAEITFDLRITNALNGKDEQWIDDYTNIIIPENDDDMVLTGHLVVGDTVVML